MTGGPCLARIRLLFLADAGAVHAQRWIEYFRRRGYQTRWLSLEEIPPGVEAVKLPRKFSARVASLVFSIPRIKREIEQFQPHLVNGLFIPNYGWIGALSGFHPLVISAWGSDVLISPQKSRLHRRRVSWSIRRADLLFSDAQIITDRMIELGADGGKIITVPLGIDPVLLEGRRDRPTSSKICTIISTRKFEPLYRNEILIRAAGILFKKKIPGLRFELIGEGSAKKSLIEQIKWMDLTDKITLRPFLPADQMYDRLSRADIYVSCSESDGTSVSLLEAMALGLYPIVSDIPANREWIEDGVNGRLFGVGDPDQLAELIAETVNSREVWLAARERNREIIRSRALWPDNMAKVEQAMLKLLR